MKNKLLISVIIIIVALGLGYWYFQPPKSPVPAPPSEIQAPPEPVKITYYCQEGSLQAEYGASQVGLSFSGGRTMILPQTVSGSGIRYEQGTTVFTSKGDNAFLTENNATTYTNCVAGTQTMDQGVSVYTNPAKTFSFAYPNKFILSGGEIGYSQSWSAETAYSGLLLTVVNIPRSFLPNTNFGEAKFTVGVSADSDALKNCLVSDYGDMGTTSVAIIGAKKFTKLTFVGVGAGNYYDTTSYRIIYDNQCYAVEYVIHSSNIYNYSPDQGIKEFDKTKIAPVLEDMARSFRFID